MDHLPMYGLTHGNRSPITCELKCGSACAFAPPNQSTEPSFREIASARLTRRNVLLSGTALAAGAALPTIRPAMADASPRHTPVVGLPFEAIVPPSATSDDFVVPDGYDWHAIIRWGDPLFDDSPPFDPTTPDAEAQALQFGYNNDYLDILVTDWRGRRALLCCNHEYVNPALMFPTGAERPTVLRSQMAAVGFSVVELERTGRGRVWGYVRGGRRNRRFTMDTTFLLTGAAAGSDLLTTAADPTGTLVLGTLNNCSGGTTPWGTILSGEENFDNFFKANLPTGVEYADERTRRARYSLTRAAGSAYLWEGIDDRFDATTPRPDGSPGPYANEPNRFGYIVEIDPYDPNSTPRKHTAMGRFAHEGANIRLDRSGTVAAYMGDDERFDYLYKFVPRRRFRRGRSRSARRHNMRLLTEGNLYVARFDGEDREDNANLGTGVWIPLVADGESMVPGFTVEEVLIFTRLAADAVQPTRMDRPEDVQPNPLTGRVYVACTNNTRRGAAADSRDTPWIDERTTTADGPNPRTINRNGHVIEIIEDGNRADATTFTWNLLLVCGEPTQAGTYFGGYTGEVSPISCPDNLAFDSEGTLWVATDGAQGIALADGLFKVPLDGTERGHVQQFLAVPRDAETCGPVIHDRDGSVFVAVQHPGENGTWALRQSTFPDYVPADATAQPGAWYGPRPSVVQVTRTAG